MFKPGLEAQILAWRFKSQPGGSNPSLEAQIPTLRLKSQPQGSNSQPQGSNSVLQTQIPVSRLKSQPGGSNPSLEAQIPALRLKSQPRGSNPSLKFSLRIPLLGQTDKQMKVPLCSTRHRPLWGRCPATHHLQSPTWKAGQRVTLTTYCPWATGCVCVCVGKGLEWGVWCGWGLAAPAHPSATIL